MSFLRSAITMYYEIAKLNTSNDDILVSLSARDFDAIVNAIRLERPGDPQWHRPIDPKEILTFMGRVRIARRS